jgi:hypothetical protein
MLPNLNMPEFKAELPSNGEQVFFRPFLVKEEKSLLIALEGGDKEEIENTVLNTLASCVKLEHDKILNLPIIDVEYLFLQLRCKSVDNVVKLSLSHQNNLDCDHKTQYDLDLNKVEVVKDPNHSNKIMLNDKIGVTMKYPTLKVARQIEASAGSSIASIFDTVASSIDLVFDEENVYDTFTHNEVVEFLENLDKVQFGKIVDFFNTAPALEYEISYVCEKCNTPEKIKLRGLQNFFG